MAERLLRCTVFTPERTVLDQSADFVVLPLEDGEMGIARMHAPLMARLGAGVLRVRLGQMTSRFYVESGFAEVFDDKVVVLTHHIVPVQQLDAKAILAQMDAVKTHRAESADQQARKQQTLERLRIQLRLADRFAGK